MDPVTAGVGISAATGIYGAISGDRANKANQNAQQQAINDQKARQAQLDQYIKPYLTQGENPFAKMLMDSIGVTPGSQGMNTGQDGFMQFLRRGGQQFDNSPQFAALNQLDMRGLTDQVAALHGSAGSLGQRFGTTMNRNEANLRRDTLQNIGARNAGIASSSFEAGANRELQARQMLAGIIGQAGGLQAQQQGQNAQLLSIMAGMQSPGFAPQQPSQLPGAMGDAGQMLMFLPFLRSAMQQRSPVTNPTLPQTGLNLPQSFWNNPLGY